MNFEWYEEMGNKFKMWELRAEGAEG